MKTQTFISRIYLFSAAHRLYNPAFNDSENQTIYDKCNNINGHGHDYTLEVTLTGFPDPETGKIITLPEFDKKVNSVLKKVNYKHLNIEVDYFKEQISSGEYIIQYLWQQINKMFPQGMLYHLKLWETSNNYFDFGYNF
jgi:6-pyruvoyltetrahydropterin/6-carboxytetrahydropterin synthase